MCEPGSGGTCFIKVFVIKVRTSTYHLASKTEASHFIIPQEELQTLVANSVDPVQTALKEQFDLHLHCLLTYFCLNISYKRVGANFHPDSL